MTAHVTQIRSSWSKRGEVTGSRDLTLRFITEDGTQVVAEAVLSERQIMDMLTGVVNRQKSQFTYFGDRKPTAATPSRRRKRSSKATRLPIALPAPKPAMPTPGPRVIEVHRAIPYTPPNGKRV